MFQIKDPHKIERSSFETILSEIGEHSFTPEQLKIAVRVIHASADFDYKDNLKFHPKAIESGVTALQKGTTILTDVHMVEAGISSAYLARLGSTKICDITHPAVAKKAKALGTTRSVIAMRRNVDLLDGGIVAIGNAPTALYEVIRLVKEEHIHPALIVGVPVGFINTVEAKDALLELDTPYITCLGRKGGSSIAAAALNALMRLAVEEN